MNHHHLISYWVLIKKKRKRLYIYIYSPTQVFSPTPKGPNPLSTPKSTPPPPSPPAGRRRKPRPFPVPNFNSRRSLSQLTEEFKNLIPKSHFTTAYARISGFSIRFTNLHHHMDYFKFLTITVDTPKIYVQQIYIPALDRSEDSSAAPLFFDLKFENKD